MAELRWFRVTFQNKEAPVLFRLCVETDVGDDEHPPEKVARAILRTQGVTDVDMYEHVSTVEIEPFSVARSGTTVTYENGVEIIRHDD